MTQVGMMDKTDIRRLAERITRELFTPGGKSKMCDRLALMVDGKYVCGWGYGPATDAVEKIIFKSLPRGQNETAG